MPLIGVHSSQVTPPFNDHYNEKYFIAAHQGLSNPSWGRYFWVNSLHPDVAVNGGYWQCFPISGTPQHAMWIGNGGWQRLHPADQAITDIVASPPNAEPEPTVLEAYAAAPKKIVLKSFKWWHEKANTLTLLRGLPMSGKTSIGYLIWLGLRSECGSRRNIYKVDFDDYSKDSLTGDRLPNEKIYSLLQEATEAGLLNGNEHIVVSAPFYSKMEVAYYKQLARKDRRLFSEIVCRGEFADLSKMKNVKGRLEL